MGGSSPQRYVLPCCGRRASSPPVAPLCFDCALRVTPLDDPLAAAYRQRVAARTVATPPAPSPETRGAP